MAWGGTGWRPMTGLSWLWAACGSSDQVASPPGPWTGDVDHSPDGECGWSMGESPADGGLRNMQHEVSRPAAASPMGAPWALPRHERAASPPRCPVADHGMPRRPAAAHPPRNVHRSPATGTAPSASVGIPPSSRGCPAAGPIIPRSTITPTPYCTPIAPVESRWGRRCLQQSSPLLTRGKQGSSPPPNTPCAFSLKLGRHILHTLTPAAHPITEHEISWV